MYNTTSIVGLKIDPYKEQKSTYHDKTEVLKKGRALLEMKAEPEAVTQLIR